jgi:hypothetical protein
MPTMLAAQTADAIKNQALMHLWRSLIKGNDGYASMVGHLILGRHVCLLAEVRRLPVRDGNRFEGACSL